MSKEEALKVLEQVCAKFVGDLQSHQVVQEALAAIRKELFKQE